MKEVNDSLFELVQNERRYRQYTNAIELKEILGYSETGEPLWGERISIYHPITSKFFEMDANGWELFDQLGHGVLTAHQGNKSLLKRMEESLLALPADRPVNISYAPNLLEQAEVYLETSEACNLRCNGCATGMDRYLTGQSQSMTRENLDLVLERTVASAAQKGIKSLRLKWAGGEALMPGSKRLIEYAQDRVKSLRVEYSDLQITQVVLTNGTWLTNETVDDIKRWGVDLSVSLWGVGEQNDISRGATRARDKFTNIVSGLERLHDAGISFGINHVITPDNAKNFGTFLRALWDTESEGFIGKNWRWKKYLEPLVLNIGFFRPQTDDQLRQLYTSGYGSMVSGTRGGFEVIRELIARGMPMQPLDRLDYLQFSGVIPTTCGSGFNYLAIGPRGVASCHEGLFGMENNMNRLIDGNVFDLANMEFEGQQDKLVGVNIAFGEIDPKIRNLLALHGGAGCPRTSRVEHNGELGHASSVSEYLYASLSEEWLALEAMRRRNLLTI